MLHKNEPLVAEGDLREIYRSKTRTLPEILNEDSFNVTKEDLSQTTVEDFGFKQEASRAVSSLDDLSSTYIFVDIGHAHLPAVASVLASHRVDTYFIIPGEIHNRFKETLKYWAREFKKNQDGIESPVTYATLVDGHRSGIEPTYKLDESHFPSVAKLKELRIKNILCLTERKAGEFYRPLGDSWEILGMKYEENGMQFRCCGIDPRPR